MNESVHKIKNYVAEEYARLASEYDRRWAFFNEATLKRTLQRLNLKEAQRLLDIGCGTGSLLEAVHERYPSIELCGVDLSVDMLDAARKKLDRHLPLIAAQMPYLPFPDRSFDAVVTCNSFHYWRKPKESLLEIARIIKPFGTVIITDWCHDYAACRIFDFFLCIFNRAHFKTYGQRKCKYLLQEAGFNIIEIERYKINWLWGIMTATAILSQNE